VDGGVDGANRLARGGFALLAGHRLDKHLRIVEIRVVGQRAVLALGRIIGGEVAIVADPVHLATAQDLELADDGNVVFRLTGDHARTATDAGVEVDDHAPCGTIGLIIGRVELRIDVTRLVMLITFVVAVRRVGVDADFLDEGRIAVELIERGFADETAAFHRVVLLRDGEGIFFIDSLYLHTGDKTGRRGGAQVVDVETGAFGDTERRRDLVLK